MKPNPHLTDAQLYDLLDRPSHATGTHLHVCAACRQELATLRASLDNFRIAATGLAATGRPPLAERRESPAPAPRFAFRSQAFAASLATAAVLIAASATLIRPRHVDPAPAAVTVTSPTATESDAALLDGIQRDLSASVPPSLVPLEVTPATTSIRSHN